VPFPNSIVSSRVQYRIHALVRLSERVRFNVPVSTFRRPFLSIICTEIDNQRQPRDRTRKIAEHNQTGHNKNKIHSKEQRTDRPGFVAFYEVPHETNEAYFLTVAARTERTDARMPYSTPCPGEKCANYFILTITSANVEQFS